MSSVLSLLGRVLSFLTAVQLAALSMHASGGSGRWRRQFGSCWQTLVKALSSCLLIAEACAAREQGQLFRADYSRLVNVLVVPSPAWGLWLHMPAASSLCDGVRFCVEE